MKTLHDNWLGNEKGVAVMLALGVLALLSMLALTFSVSTTTAQKMANNYNDLTAARMVAVSGLNRVIAGMHLYSDDVNKDFSDVFSHNQEAVSDEVKREGLGGNDGLLTTAVSGLTYYSLPVNYNVNNYPTWQYVPFDRGVDSPIIARFAYVVVPTSGKIDPSACIDSGFSAQYYGHHDAVSEAPKPGVGGASGTYDGQDGVEKTSFIGPNADDFVIGRPGRDISEIFLRTMDDAATWLNDAPASKKYAQKISSHWASPSGELRLKGGGWSNRWPDFDTLFNELKVDEGQKGLFKMYFALDNPPDPEAFWYEDDDFIKVKEELFHRFDLTRSNWSDITVDSIKASPVEFSNTYSETAVTSIPWLKNWKAFGDMGDSEICKNQVIANLIDYNDVDTIATTDSEDNPTIVGLERCPYINEVKLAFEGVVNSTALSPVLTRYECKVYLKQIALELVNMYDTGNLNTTAAVSVSGSYRWTPNPDGVDSDVYFQKIVPINNINIPIDSKSYASITYDLNADSDISPLNNINKTGTTPSNITNFQISNLDVKLIDGVDSDFYDYSYIVQSPTADQTLSPNGALGNLYYDAQVADPRQNLNESDWSDSQINSDPTIGTLNSTNSNFAPNPGGNADSEPGANDPWEISTAFVRNAPMKSPWELGFIHRGAKWQTINLKRYNVSEGQDGGGNNYEDGDANILDQTKMFSATEIYGKINLNTGLMVVLKALFEKIRVGSDFEEEYNNDGPGSLSRADGTLADEVDAAIATALAEAVLDNNGTNSGSQYYTRAQLLRDTVMVNAFCYDGVVKGVNVQLNRNTDATQEEIIGKFINLTKAQAGGANEFTVIVIAQIIKDIGIQGTSNTVNVNGVNCMTGRYDLGGDKILATEKVLATVIRNPETHTFRIKRIEYLD